MSTTRSDRVYEWWIQEATKFDYFVLGAALTLVGYVSSTISHESLTLGPAAVQAGSLMAILGSAIAGFMRIEASLSTLKANHEVLHALEGTGNLLRATEGQGPYLNDETGEVLTHEQAIKRASELKELARQAKGELAKWAARAKRRYHVRNATLIVGLAGLGLAWVWGACVGR